MPEIGTPGPILPDSLDLDYSAESSWVDLGFPSMDSPDCVDYDTAISRTDETPVADRRAAGMNSSSGSTQVATCTARTAKSPQRATGSIRIPSSESIQNEEDCVDTIPTVTKSSRLIGTPRPSQSYMNDGPTPYPVTNYSQWSTMGGSNGTSVPPPTWRNEIPIYKLWPDAPVHSILSRDKPSEHSTLVCGNYTTIYTHE